MMGQMIDMEMVVDGVIEVGMVGVAASEDVAEGEEGGEGGRICNWLYF